MASNTPLIIKKDRSELFPGDFFMRFSLSSYEYDFFVLFVSSF